MRQPAPPRLLGFTLIEVVVVMAVIAILALMAVPNLTDRTVRQQVAATLEHVQFARQAVADRHALTGTFPADNEEALLPPADRIVGSFLSSVTVRDGVLDLVFGNGANSKLAGKRLSLRPAAVPDYPQVPVVWICAGASVPDKMEAHGEDTTDVPALYLPPSCRPGAGAKPKE